MEEILELKELLLKGDMKSSLVIVEELAEMGKKDIVNNIRSFAIILLLHLIKQEVENRRTRSWDISIRNSVLEIQSLNKCRKAGGYYLPSEELKRTLAEALSQAINKASLEVDEGRYQPEELEETIEKEKIIEPALSLILQSA